MISLILKLFYRVPTHLQTKTCGATIMNKKNIHEEKNQIPYVAYYVHINLSRSQSANAAVIEWLSPQYSITHFYAFSVSTSKKDFK